MSVAGRKQASTGAMAARHRDTPTKPGRLTFNPVHAAYGNAYASAVEIRQPAGPAAAPFKSATGRKPVSAGIHVTQEHNKPLKRSGKLTFNSVHAAYGNGYASALGSGAPMPAPNAPAKFVPATKQTAPGIAVTQEQSKPVKPGNLSFHSSHAVYGPAYARAAGPEPVFPAKAGSPAQAKATVGPDGTVRFADDAIRAKSPDAQPTFDDPLAKLVPDVAAKAAPEDAKPDDRDAKTRQAMTRPADAPDALAQDAKEDEAKPGVPTDADTLVPGKDRKPAPSARPGADAPLPAASGGGGSGGGDGDLAAWKTRVSGAIAATPKPTLGDGAASSITVISATGKGAAAKYRSGGGGAAAKDVKKAVRPPPKTPEPLPEPPKTAVPAADEVVKLASDKKLPDQELPVLQQRPGDAVIKEPAPPVLDKALAEELGTSFAEPPAPETNATGGAKKPLDAKALKKLKDAKAKQPQAKKTSAGEKLVLQDVAPKLSPRPERGTKGQSKETFRLVLGEMLRDPGPKGEAKAIVDEARTEAYPNRSLDKAYPILGADWNGPVTAELEAQVKKIADIAGITDAELVQAKAAREAQLEAMKNGAVADLAKAAGDSRKTTKEGGEAASRDILAARLAQDEDTLQKAIAANGEADPQVIELRRDMGVRDLTQRAARQDVNYEKAGERRLRALDASQARMRSAYANAAKADEKQISALNYKQLYDAQIAANKEPKDAEAAAQARLEQLAKPMWDWVQLRAAELRTAFETLKTAATTTTKTYREGIKAALAQAKSMFAEWADERISAQESWWDGLMREFRQWMKDAQSDSAAWEEARNEQLRDAVVGDLQLVADAEAAARKGLDMQAFIQERGVDAAQLAVIQTFFKPVGPKGKQQLDSIGAVAAGMRFRVRAIRKPQMIDRFKADLQTRPESEWWPGSIVAADEKPPFSVAAITSKLFGAMNQWGTEEGDIYAALAGLTPLQAKIVRDHYHQTYSGRRGGRTLDQDLDYELSGAEKHRADALLSGNQALADAAELREAMKGGLTGAGTDEATIMRVLRNKTPEEQAAIKAEYARMYDGADLDADLKDELDDGWGSKHDIERAQALRANDVQLADAIGLDAAMHGGITGAGTDEGEITQIYEQNRAEMEAEAAKHGWSTERMNAEIKQRNRLIEQKYEGRYGDPRNIENPTALRAAFKNELSDSELDLGIALADADLNRIDAAKLGVEKESFWSSSDETINKIFESQGKRARQDVTRDAELDLNRRADLAALQGKKWDWKAEREKTRAFIESETQKRAETYMGQLESTYDKKFGTGGMVLLIAFNMSGEDQDKAWDLRKQGGILQPEQEIFYACNGAGTDLDKLKEVLKGKSPAQVQAIREAWVKRYGGKAEDFDARIKEEVSGRDLKDMEWALEGEPQTRAEKRKRAEERKNYEHSGYGWFNTDETDAARAIVDREYEGLLAESKELDKLSAAKGANESDADYAARQDRKAMYEERFDLRAGYFDVAVEDHRKAIDSFADTAATIAAIVATVIVIVVAAVLTGGTAGAAIVAALASAKVAAITAAAAALATIGTKLAIKGGANSHGELAIDAVVGAVDAVVSVATAGIGGGLLKAARAGGPTSRLAAWAAKTRLAGGLSKMAKSERMVARVFAGAVSEGIEGVASTLPSALAGNLIDEKNWAKGNPLANILQGTVVQTGMAVALSGGMGGLGGISKHVPEGPLTRETGDILAKRGDPVDRLAAWKAWKVDNPGVPFKQFSEQFDAGIIAKDVDDAARRALQREMRGELLAGIPPAQRKQFAGVPIEVISDADFARLTKSASGQAVVIFKDGKPLVLLRETADIKSLREEGIHLLQSKDPKLRKQFKRLDEANLARWNKMGLDEQLSLYRTKIDIELDAQTKLIKQLDDQLAALDNPALRKSLLAQRRAAGETLENLGRRLDELGEISPLDRIKMARGDVPKPQYLDQEPRLFAKSKGLTGDPGMRAAAARFDTADLDARQLQKQLAGTDASELFTKIANMLRKRKSSSFSKIWEIMAKQGKAFGEIAGEIADDLPRFDITLGFDRFVKVAKELAANGPPGRLKEVLEGLSDLLTNKKIPLGEVDPFLPMLAKIDNPKALLDTVGAVAQLDNFRNKELVNLGRLVGEAAAHGPQELSDFLSKLKALTEKANKRDLIDRSKNIVDWLAAHQQLKVAVQELKDTFPGGATNKRLLDLGDEFEKNRAFSFDKFKASMLADNPLGDPSKSSLSKLIKELGPAFGSGDVGALMVWDNVVTRLTKEMGDKADTLLAAIKGDLAKGIKKELSQVRYDRFRHALQNATIDHILESGTPAQKLSRFRSFMTFFRSDKASDAASIGEYFADLQREIFSNPGNAGMKGDMAAAFGKDIPSRKIAGISDTRMVDGAIEFTAPKTVNGVDFEAGIYLTEAKAGSSKNAKQARLYHQLLGEGKLQTVGSTPAKGVVIQAENADFARIQAAMLDNEVVDGKRGLHRGIIVTYLDESGQTKIYPRTRFDASELVDDLAKLGKGGK